MLISALVLGLLGSLHCLGMCGPIAFMLPLSHDKPVKKALQLSLYHLGRVLAYALLGLAFGFVGKGLYLFGVQQKVSIIIGVIMIFLVFVPLKKLGAKGVKNPFYTWVAKAKKRLGVELNKRSSDTFLTIGFLNGFLPCGLVYMALLGAVAMANAWQGAMYMLLFGLGTIPLMTTVVYFSSWFGQSFKQKFQKLFLFLWLLLGCCLLSEA